MKPAAGVLDRVRCAPRWQLRALAILAVSCPVAAGSALVQHGIGLAVVLSMLIGVVLAALGFLVILIASYIEDALDRRRGL